MGQSEIIEWLAMLRCTKDNNYYSLKDILKVSKCNERATKRAIYRLLKDRIIETNNKDYIIGYRMKKQIYETEFKLIIVENKS